MHPLLRKLFEKRGVKDVTDLSPTEKEDFDRWGEILNKEKLEIEDIKEFCEVQRSVIEKQFANLDEKRNEKLVTQYVIYKKLLDLIESPSKERETLIHYLEGLTK